MKRAFLTIVLLTFGVHTAWANERESMAIKTYEAGTAMEPLVLPAVTGGTPPLMYSLSGLPAGLSFDPATQTISGTPIAVREPTVVTYTVTDANGASRSLPFLVAVTPSSLAAPAALVAEDFMGTDGVGDQGGFVLLTWDLSEDHDSLVGYRIFREMPGLGGEMMPWATVHAVPGANIGRAVVAVSDNVAANWGIAAVPRLKSTEEMLQLSDVTETEEPARAIDNIPPAPISSLRVLDAPDDEGGRIFLRWKHSPAGGTKGYRIYRRAAGADEFVLLAQIESSAISFVDETALNGVRYTYQVRPFDDDNETTANIEQTAMAIRNRVVDSEGRALFGLFGADNSIGFDDFFLFADRFGLTAEDSAFDPAFDLAPSAAIDFDDFFIFADNFGRSTGAAGKRVPRFAGLNADARLYLEARTALPSVGEDFVLDVRVADFAAVKGYGIQVQYEADKLEFVQARTEQPLGESELAAPQVLADEAGVLTVAAHGGVVSDGEVALSLVFRATTEVENAVIEVADSQTYDSAFGFNRLALPAPVQVQTRPQAFALANNYPNPFNPATTIKYALPQAADVELTVYNVVGQAVQTLVAEHQSAGRYVVEWDATDDSGHSLSSGMYFYRLEAGGAFYETKKMLLLK